MRIVSGFVAFWMVAFGSSAFARGKVVLYTAHQSSVIRALAPLFEKETGIKTKVVQLGERNVIGRVRDQARTPKADVIWSISGSLLSENEDLLQAYKPRDAASIDPRLEESEAWTPYMAVIHVVLQNTRIAPESDSPRKLMDLADPKWTCKIATDTGLLSSGGLSMTLLEMGSSDELRMTLRLVYPEDWRDRYDEIRKNFHPSLMSAIPPCRAAVALSLTPEDQALAHKVGGAPVKLVYLEDGTRAEPIGIALVKGGPHPENGKKFIDWALSKKTQEFLVKETCRRSVRHDVAGPGDVPRLSSLNLVVAKSVAPGWTTAIREKFCNLGGTQTPVTRVQPPAKRR